MDVTVGSIWIVDIEAAGDCSRADAAIIIVVMTSQANRIFLYSTESGGVSNSKRCERHINWYFELVRIKLF